LKNIAKISGASRQLTVAGVPEGFDTLVIADTLRQLAVAGQEPVILHIARDDARMSTLADELLFFAPEVEIVTFPAWDCLPYDRASPHSDISAKRMAALSRLAHGPAQHKPGKTPKRLRVVITTVNAAAQRLPASARVAEASFLLAKGQNLDIAALTAFLGSNGYTRSGTVMEAGEYAIRGGIIDIFPAGAELPLRLDLFGDEIDSIRPFDPLTQRSDGKVDEITLLPANEIMLDKQAISRFRSGYIAEFGAVSGSDPLYEAVTEGRRHQGAEHWLPLFHEKLETLFDYLPGAVITLDYQVAEALADRFADIADYYAARSEVLASKASQDGTIYKPLPPARLYLNDAEWQTRLSHFRLRQLTPHHLPEDPGVIDLGGKRGRDFAPERNQEGVNIYDALREHVGKLQAASKRVLIASYSLGSRERMATVLKDHGLDRLEMAGHWHDTDKLGPTAVGLVILPLENGFETDTLALITEQDILGDRLIRKSQRSRRAENFLTEASSLEPGDLVVHMDHGIGRYEGLKTIDVSGAPHDCVLLTYAGGDRLYVPVENIEVLSRYGGEDANAPLDKLGSPAWQARKAKLKERIREMAGELIRIAADRELKNAVTVAPPEGLYDEFCARFPYNETDDQLRAISDIIDDLGSGRPMDRLVCGDVGFGKTEVALRAAFLAAMSGLQVAVVTPTTLLCRQHVKTFEARFKGLPVRIGHLSRLAHAKDMASTRAGLADGRVDIVIGTHALLSKNINFRNLGLLIIDEEQHFGVAHKERLKQLKTDVHVLTLTATPIPRTLQLAMSGLKGLSLIATPPVDRLAVRTFVLPLDPLVVREALLREKYRGGQSFYVCPRVADLDAAMAFLRETVPEVKVVIAHGQMAAGQIDDVMNAFYDGAYDVLLSTTIVESGLDIPTANTLIIHRADMFGLAQLYQLRGRVGRSKVRAYAYLTLPPGRLLTPAAQKRLEVLEALDTLGAGFTLASHDLDIRGAGNLLGEEQSGHIREVGLELYQQMLEEAVAEARSGGAIAAELEGNWSPQINVGATVMIPEHFVPDLNLRMGLYRRLAEVGTKDQINGFAAELIDRFGKLPEEVEQLLKIIEIKSLCRTAGIEKIETGPKGAIVAFRKDHFANPAGLVEFLSKQTGTAKLRPDNRLVYMRRWDNTEERLKGALHLAGALAKIALAA
jgi:transcription-repair coupling factor (superfamily II helicase)